MDWTYIKLTCGGTDYTAFLSNAEQVATLPNGPDVGRATFTLLDDGTMPDLAAWTQVILYAGPAADPSQKVWVGYATRITSEPQSITGGVTHLVTVDCQGAAILLVTGPPISETFYVASETAIIAVLKDYLPAGMYNATKVNPVPPTAVDYIAFVTETLRSCMNKLVERTGKAWGVDAEGEFYYKAAGTFGTYAYGLSETPNNTTTFPMRVKPFYDVDAVDVRNKVRVIGGWTLSEVVTETDTGDASTVIFYVGYRPERVESVTVDGVAQRVGVDFVDPPAEFDVLVNWDRKWFRFTYPPINGAVIVFRYRYPVRVDETVEDAASIAALGLTLWGNTIEDTTLSSAAQAQLVGENYLAWATASSDRAQVTTTYSTASGLPWQPGYIVEVTATSLGWSAKQMTINGVTLRAQPRPGGTGLCLVHWDLDLGTVATLGRQAGTEAYKNSSTFEVTASNHVPEIMAPVTNIDVADFLSRNDGVSGNFQALDGTLIYVIDGQIVAIGPATSVASNQHSCMTPAILGGVFTGSVYEDAKYFLSGKI